MRKKMEIKSGAPEGTDSKILETIVVPFELKSLHAEGEDFFIVEGYASAFGLIDTYNDRIEKGAYLDTIKNTPKGFPAHVMHDRWTMPVGLFFELKEDKKGLFVKSRLPKADDLVKGRLVPQIKTGSIDALSIGFRAKEFHFVEEDDVSIRVLTKIDLKEISFINIGMQADEGALLTGIKKNGKFTESQNMINAMVDAHRKGATDEIKQQIIEFYHQDGTKNPFEDNAVISTNELQNLSKSNLAYAIRELKISSNASNYLAGLVLTPTSVKTKDPKSENTEKNDPLENNSPSEEEKSLISKKKKSDESVSTSLDKLINTFKIK